MDYQMIRIRKPSETDAELQKMLFNVKDNPNQREFDQITHIN